MSRYWGKARDRAGGRWHPLAYHQADVAACAVAIGDARPWMFDWMADRLGRDHGWDALTVRRMIAVFGYAHDVGKHAIGFQVQAEYAFRACTGRSLPAGIIPARDDLRHDALGLIAWVIGLPGAPLLSEAVLGADLDEHDLEAWCPLASAAFGHHGHPTDPDAPGVLSSIGEVMRPDDLAAACACCARFRQIVGDFPPCIDVSGGALVSIPLAGLIQVADWMGSDRERFDYAAADVPLATYWDRAQVIAQQAVGELGLVPARPAPWRGVAPIVAPHPPTPMQVAAAEVTLDGPFPRSWRTRWAPGRPKPPSP